MSRSDYSEDCDDNWSTIRWRGAVASAIRGKRGQAFLRDLAEAMDAMPVKRLIAEELQADGEFCTIGVLGNARGIDMAKIDPDDADQVADAFGISSAMAREIVYENDERIYFKANETPEQRWIRMRKWVEDKLAKPEESK